MKSLNPFCLRIVLAASVILSALIVSQCLLIGGLGGFGSTGTTTTDNTDGGFSFFLFDPLSNSTPTTISYHLDITDLSATHTVLSKFEYRGRIPVKTTQMWVEWKDQKYMGNQFFGRDATMSFHPPQAMTYTFHARVIDRHQRTHLFSRDLKVIHRLPPSISEPIKLIPNDGFFIPGEQNQSFLWMKLYNPYTPIFTDAAIANIRDNTRVYLNYQDITSTFFFNPSQIFFSGFENQMIVLGNTNLTNLKLGENRLDFYFGKFHPDETSLASATVYATAVYPDNKPPEILSIDVHPMQSPTDGFSDFKVLGNFSVYIDVEDQGVLTYPKAGLREIEIVISSSFTPDISVTYPIGPGVDRGLFAIPVPMSGSPDGPYNMIVRVRDRAQDLPGHDHDNIAYSDPIPFQYGHRPYKTLTIQSEKVSGYLQMDQYYVGETIDLSISGDYYLDSISWQPAGITPKGDGYKAQWANLPIGNWLVEVSAQHHGTDAFGKLPITVHATPLSHDQIPPVVRTDPVTSSEPGNLITLIVEDETALPDTDELKNMIESTSDANKYGAAGEWITFLVPYLFAGERIHNPAPGIAVRQTFLGHLHEFNATTTALEAGEKVIWTFRVQDAAGNESQHSIRYE